MIQRIFWAHKAIKKLKDSLMSAKLGYKLVRRLHSVKFSGSFEQNSPVWKFPGLDAID